MRETRKKTTGFKNYLFTIHELYFADDGLLLAHSEEDTVEAIGQLQITAGSMGLDINISKSSVIIFNEKKQPEEIKEIKVTNKIKYLGVWINNSKNMFKEHKKETLKKAEKLANITYPIIGKSCNKVMIGKTFWKCICLPGILFASAIIPYNKTEIAKLQRTENKVFRQILGAPKYTPICTLRGEIGASLMETRITKSRLQYLRSTLTLG